MGNTIHVAKIKALISFAVTAKLICVFVFAYAKNRFSHDKAQIDSIIEINPPLVENTGNISQDYCKSGKQFLQTSAVEAVLTCTHNLCFEQK